MDEMATRMDEVAARMDAHRYEYVIDANDVIREVNQAWNQFAEENGTRELPGKVLGTWLWQHLGGLEVKHLYRTLLERVREGQKTVRVPFRCDSPETRRYMMLEVTPLPDGAVKFSSWIEEEAGRPRIDLLDPGLEHNADHLLRMCAWCKRIDAGAGDWRELEDAMAEGEIFRLEALPQITHAVCTDCQDRVLREIQEAEQTGRG